MIRGDTLFGAYHPYHPRRGRGWPGTRRRVMQPDATPCNAFGGVFPLHAAAIVPRTGGAGRM